MTSTQIDTIIANLTATYTELTTKLTTNLSAAGRAATFQQLKDIRAELDEWEARKQQTSDATSGNSGGGFTAVAQFVDPA